MKWHNYRTAADELFVKRQDGTRDNFYKGLEKSFRKSIDSAATIDGPDGKRMALKHALLVQANSAWEQLRRPYYNVWPGVERALLSVDYGMDPMLIPPMPMQSMLARIEDSRVAEVGFRAALFFDAEIIVEGTDRRERWLLCDIMDVHGKCHQLMEPMDTIHRFKTAPEEARFGWKPISLYVGLCLLAADATFIEPDVLNEDIGKAEAARAAGDQATLDRLAERAEQRGKIGWTVGRTIEVCPHLRRPHFAIRWTQKGRTTPKLVPVRASVVRRHKMTEVPTGYLADEPADRISTDGSSVGV